MSSWDDSKSVGAVFMGLIGTISGVSSTFILFSIFLFRMYKKRPARLIVCLCVSDIFQSIGVQFSYGWIKDGIENGSTCIAQGWIINFADLASSFWVCVICIYTIMYGLYDKNPKWFEYVAHAICWPSAIFMSSLAFAFGGTPEETYTSVGVWCWISAKHTGLRFGLHYFWIYFTFGFLILMYGWMGYRLKQISLSSSESKSRQSKNLKKLLRKMAGYPIVYCVIFIPLAIHRTMLAAGENPPFSFLVAAFCLFAGNGFFNAFVYGITRKIIPRYKLFLAGKLENSSMSSKSNIEKDTYGSYELNRSASVSSKTLPSV